MENKDVHYGKEGYQLYIKVLAYSWSNLTCQNIASKSGVRMKSPVKIREKFIDADFYGRNIKVKGLEVGFTLDALRKADFKEYEVTICNEQGNASITLDLIPEGE